MTDEIKPRTETEAEGKEEKFAECPKCGSKVAVHNLAKHLKEVHGEVEFDLSVKQRQEILKLRQEYQAVQMMIGQVRFQMKDLESQDNALYNKAVELSKRQIDTMISFAKAKDLDVPMNSRIQFDLDKSNTVKIELPKDNLPPRQNK